MIRISFALATLIFILVHPTSAQMTLKIDRPACAPMGTEISVPLHLENSEPATELGGFDLLVTYDTTLLLQTTELGQLPSECEWEYFQYQTLGANSVRLLGIAETNNGPVHPSCFAEEGGDLARLRFLLPCDSSLNEVFLPIRFEWYDCGDNTVSTRLGDTLYLSRFVYDYLGGQDVDITADSALPTRCGAPEACMEGGAIVPSRGVDFYNGGVLATLRDIVPPSVLCPNDLVLHAQPDQCGATTVFQANVSDNLGSAIVWCNPPSGAFFPVGETAVQCIGEDEAGNRDTCGFTVTVLDTMAPVLDCPADVIAAAQPGLCGASVTYTVSLTDDCPGSVWCQPSSGSFFPIGTSPVSCIGVDGSGNATICEFAVTVYDDEAPSVACHNDTAVGCNPGECGAVVAFSVEASDNCSLVSVVSQPASGSFFDVGVTPVQIVATDSVGLADTCEFEVTVVDNDPPVIACPDNIEVENDPGVEGAIVAFDLVGQDNCPGMSLSAEPAPGELFGVGATTVTISALDFAGNVDTCQFTVTVTMRDRDRDGVPDMYDNCPDAGNPDQADTDHDLVGDRCDICPGHDDASDADGDGAPDGCDNCPSAHNPAQEDDDSDGVGDLCDQCPGFDDVADHDSDGQADSCDNCPTTANSDQLDSDADGAGDLCDRCPGHDDFADGDDDTIPDGCDNCPDVPNPDQADIDSDGLGDMCCCRVSGDINYDGSAPPDISDLVALVNFMFQAGPAPLCADEANVDGSSVAPLVDIADLVYFVSFMFDGGPAPVPCP